MKKIIVYITLAILVAACAPSSRHSGEVTGVGGTAWNEPTPYGMVLISRGSYKMGPAEKDSIWGTQQEPRAVSIDAFWMDETEITNSKIQTICILGTRLYHSGTPRRSRLWRQRSVQNRRRPGGKPHQASVELG